MPNAQDPINVYAYTGDGDLYPSMVVNILQATSHEEVLKVIKLCSSFVDVSVYVGWCQVLRGRFEIQF